ncbi:hypothetical protein [Paenibacillus cymbidii]|uniref:hypothetical protein n=1 Tax=Paenibacillus cymbidii TaxID=1639034 RepID=UPI0014368D94|nr:hypothetical protein [Paenibacillus cymbidii]
MEKNLKIASFQNGYSINEMRCFDHPVAVGASYYDNLNYYYYCFLYAVNVNWCNQYYSWYHENPILKLLGIECCKIAAHDHEDPISKITKLIDNNYPVIIPTTFNSIFYHREYRKRTDLHTLLVTSYNNELGTIGIKESPRSLSPDFTRDNGLINFVVTEAALREIWCQSQNVLLTEMPKQYASIYYLKKVGSPKISQYSDLVCYLLQDVNMDYNLFSDWIDKTNIALQDGQEISQVIMERARVEYVSSLSMFFDILETVFVEKLRDVEFRMKLSNLRRVYTTSRDRIYNITIKHAIQRQPIDGRELSQIRNRLKERDMEMIETLTDAMKGIPIHVDL